MPIVNNRYRIERNVGRGGMAEVFLAHDLLLDRPVALKVLFAEYANDPNFVERFRREAQSAAGLTHPNIVEQKVEQNFDSQHRLHLKCKCLQ